MSVGYRNRFGHPRPEVVERYRERQVQVLRTDHSGALRLTLGAGALQAQQQRALARRYWRSAPPAAMAAGADTAALPGQ
jgi:competence protein ComEC